MASKVYFTDFRATHRENLPQKLARLVKKAGMLDIDFENKYTAIKIHFGEPGNLAYLRPNYSKVIVDLIKEAGGKVFLTDCNTLYVGRRKNALDHLEAAYENGYNPFTTGCHVIIADGLKGTDEALIPIDGEYVKEAKIGQAVMDADIVISMNHFKGHEAAGFGGALKNLGMGCGSFEGKKEMHSTCQPIVDEDACVGCGVCAESCAHGAPMLQENGKMRIDLTKCAGCGRCIGQCPIEAIHSSDSRSNEILGCKIAEYTKTVLDGRPHFHISLVRDVSPFCDCYDNNDIPIVPDVGMFASFDPVALDLACAEAVMRQPIVPGSELHKANRPGMDHFTATSPNSSWRSQIEHGKKIGLGQDSYELITV